MLFIIIYAMQFDFCATKRSRKSQNLRRLFVFYKSPFDFRVGSESAPSSLSTTRYIMKYDFNVDPDGSKKQK